MRLTLRMDMCWKLGGADWDRPSDAAALQQSRRYAETIRAMGGAVACYRLGDAALAQVVQRRFGRWAALGLVSRGPIWHTSPPPEIQSHALRQLRRTATGALLVTPEAGQAGLLPLYSGAAVAEIALGPKGQMRRAMQGKWRNRLGKAESARLKVEMTRDPDILVALIDKDLKQQRAKRYRALSPKFIANWVRIAPQGFRVFRAKMRGESIAELLMLDHAPGVTYQIGWSSGAGRALNAQNLLLWHAMCYFADKGRARLDLGLVDSVNAPGLARFKLGTGAALRQLGPTGLVLPKLWPGPPESVFGREKLS